MLHTYDVVVLGAGNAGMGAAAVTREAGRSVAIVEANGVGGTCPLRGCVPKKVLVAAAEALEAIKTAPLHQIETGPAKLDWAALVDREQSFTQGISESFEASLGKRGIDLLKGEVRFTASNMLRVGSEEVEAGKTVIATGSIPRRLPFPGAEHMITSDDILLMRDLPESLAFIGGGVIALEFSHVLVRAGCKVTILEVTDRLLPGMDSDAVAKLHAATEGLGIEVATDAEMREITPADGGFEVQFAQAGQEKILTVARVANGAGRVPNVEHLDLDAAEIEHDGPKIAVTEHLRSTSNHDVYVAGDALSGSAQLSPLATYEGRVAGQNILDGDEHVPEYHPVPAVVFTVPALASVGMTEAAAAKTGARFEVKATDMTGWFSARLYGSDVAYAKILIEEEGRRILGAHLVGKRSEELIHLFAMAMKHGMTADDMAGMVYAFPTFSSEVKSIV